MKDNEKCIESRQLGYVFTKDEHIEKSKELASANRQVEELKDGKKSVMAQLNSQISAQEEMVNMLTWKVSNGREDREVECEILFHKPSKGMKTVVRTDIDETRTDMEREIVEKMTEKDWMLWSDKFQKIECDVEMHVPNPGQKTYTQRSTGHKFIENMTDTDSLVFEDECLEIKLQSPKDGWKTLIHPSGVNVEMKMSPEDIEKCQLNLFPSEKKIDNDDDLDSDPILVDEEELSIEG